MPHRLRGTHVHEPLRLLFTTSDIDGDPVLDSRTVNLHVDNRVCIWRDKYGGPPAWNCKRKVTTARHAALFVLLEQSYAPLAR